jgi:hypothetical protein
MSGEKIAIVDDDEAMVETLCDVLELHGWAPVRASNGLEAVKLVTTEGDRRGLMDIRMPKMNGVDACGKSGSDGPGAWYCSRQARRGPAVARGELRRCPRAEKAGGCNRAVVRSRRLAQGGVREQRGPCSETNRTPGSTSSLILVPVNLPGEPGRWCIVSRPSMPLGADGLTVSLEIAFERLEMEYDGPSMERDDDIRPESSRG